MPTLCASAVIAMLALAAVARGEEFSHKQHAATKLQCVYCHAEAVKSQRAGLPTVGRCMLCHQTMSKATPLLERIAGLPSDAPAFDSKRYLADFVYFSHARHSKAKLDCAVCHGAVFARAEKPLMPVKMKACVDCHKAHQAKTGCDTCHELGQ